MFSKVHALEVDTKAIYTKAIELWKPFFLYIVIFYLALGVLGTLLAFTKAAIVLVVGLIWLVFRFTLTHALIVENQYVLTKAMDESFKMTKGHAFNLFNFTVTTFIPLIVIFLIFSSSMANIWVNHMLTFFAMLTTIVLNVGYYRYFIYLHTTQYREDN